MQIPKYWSRQSVEKTINGRKFQLSCSGWSSRSLSEATQKAYEIADRVFAAIQSGREKQHYLYSDRPIREEIVEELGDDAVVTRTGYGSLVLNTGSVMFIDIDNPEISLFSAFASWIKSLFGKTAGDPLEQWRQKIQQNIDDVCRRRGLNIRLYSTFKGLRGIVTNKTFAAGSAEAEQILRELRSDYLYIRLCKAQDCFRARLTPKPFRCGYSVPRYRFPYANAEQESSQRKWVAGYDRIVRNYATCRYIGEIGSGGMLSQIDEIVRYHDRLTRTSDNLALA